MSAIVTALSWVPRGVAKAIPSKYVLNEAELERVSKLAAVELGEAKMQLAAAQALAKAEADGMDVEAEEWEEFVSSVFTRSNMSNL